MMVNSGRIQETDMYRHMYIIEEEANEQTRMYSHFVATRMTTGEWPPFFYSSGKWTCSIVIYSSASRYMYERIHCHSITGKQPGYLALMQRRHNTRCRERCGIPVSTADQHPSREQSNPLYRQFLE